MKELNYKQYLNRAEVYCAKSEHCPAELDNKLREWGCIDNNWRNDIIDNLIDNGFINEQRYCRAFVHDKFLYQSWGKVKIRTHLRQKRIDSRLIEEALLSIDEQQYDSQLEQLIKNKLDDTRDIGEKERASIFRFCLQRGFEYSKIAKLIGSCDIPTEK